MAEKLLIEKYLTYMRTSEERARSRIRSSQQQYQNMNMVLAEAYGMLVRNLAERAIKYRMAKSALAMIDTLRPHPLLQDEMSLQTIIEISNGTRELDPDIHTPVLYQPDRPVWIELEEPLFTQSMPVAGLYFTSNDLEVERMLTLDLKPSIREALLQARKKPDQETTWHLQFIGPDGTPKSHYEYWQESQAWCITPHAEPCPTDECVIDYEVNDLTGKRSPDFVLPCNFCATVLAYWRSYFSTALLVAQGHFAATDQTDWPVRTETTKRKVQRAQSAKYDELEVKHTYYLVNFDASVRKLAPLEQGEPERRGSWVTARLEIDPESVVYVRQSFGKSRRILDPERNPRWRTKQTIEVKGHERRIPLTAQTARQRIVRVMASMYEQTESEG